MGAFRALAEFARLAALDLLVCVDGEPGPVLPRPRRLGRLLYALQAALGEA